MHFNLRADSAPMAQFARNISVLGACMALVSCTVGPAYHKPEAPNVASYTATPAPLAIAAAPSASGSSASAQIFKPGATVNSHWWQGFGSAALDRLVDQALAHNPDLDAAQATLEQAQFQLKAAQGVFYPQVALGLGGERTRSSGAATGGMTGPQLYNLYTGQVSVSYYPDVFGLNRLVTRSQQALVDVAQDQLSAARLMIVGNVVNTAIGLAALDDEITATQENVRDEEQVLGLARKRYQLGATAQFDVLTQESQLASTKAQLAQLRQARAAARHLLATVTGRLPAQAGDMQTPKLTDLRLPATLPLSLPSALVRNRPDIRAAEAQLRAANAQVGEAVAQMYPSLQLTAGFGQQSNFANTFFDPASRLWNLAAGLVAPLFEGGTLEARKNAAQAAYRGMFATYRGTVLGAFRNVADVLRALEHDSAFLEAQARAMQAARQALALVTTQYSAGQVDYLNLLTSETQYQNTRVAFVKAQAQRYADTAALYVALGGGEWGAAPSPAAAAAAGAQPQGDRHGSSRHAAASE
ncbi:MAG: efflux transporter outer membrane subunit [Candidimonas sp.]|nr:MAG: efflux transporter outer membrane subunit [Candidimonas sp.]